MLTFCVDANIVINLHRRFPRDVWPSVWDRFEGLVATGRAVLPREVLIELDRIDDDCVAWCKSLDDFVEQPTQGEVNTVTTIAVAHPGWVSEQQNQADPWVVAHALRGGRTVITEERRRGFGTADHNLGIPNVADEFHVPSLDLNGLARSEGWTF